MEKEKLVEKLNRLKSRWKKVGSRTGQKVRDNAAMMAIGAATAMAPTGVSHVEPVHASSHPFEIEALNLRWELTPEMVKIVPEKVVTDKNLIEFHNKAVDERGNPVRDFKGATPYSIWDVTYQREVGSLQNPVGVFNSFAGTMQYNKANVQSMLMYALMHDEYSSWAEKFFEKNDGAVKALAAMKSEYAEKGNLVFHVGSKSRREMSRFIVSDYKQKFTEDGEANPVEALSVQRDFGSDAYVSFDEEGWKKIVSTLAKNNIDVKDVSWAIIGMWCSRHIAVGGFGNISRTLEGKSLKEINSAGYIDVLAAAYPSVFKSGSGKKAYEFAKKHYKEPHSITTMRELSLMDKNPEIYQDYLNLLSAYQGHDVTLEEARLLAASDGKKTEKKSFQVSPQMLARAYVNNNGR